MPDTKSELKKLHQLKPGYYRVRRGEHWLVSRWSPPGEYGVWRDSFKCGQRPLINDEIGEKVA